MFEYVSALFVQDYRAPIVEIRSPHRGLRTRCQVGSLIESSPAGDLVHRVPRDPAYDALVAVAMLQMATGCTVNSLAKMLPFGHGASHAAIQLAMANGWIYRPNPKRPCIVTADGLHAVPPGAARKLTAEPPLARNYFLIVGEGDLVAGERVTVMRKSGRSSDVLVDRIVIAPSGVRYGVPLQRHEVTTE